jgi:CarboxypepD_reg-like domain/TonB-dependent Receptor Plug Domain
MWQKLGACVIALFIGSVLQAQGTIKGFVKDASTGEPMLFLTVGLENTAIGTQTDENGYYSMTKVPDGTYTVMVSLLGFETFRQEVVVSKESIATVTILLEKGDIELKEIVISEEKTNARNNINISVETIRPKDIKRVPGVGGQADLAQMLTTLPGFITTGDQGGQIYVRGGSPVQNKVLLDGMIVYNAFHSIGMYSVFDTDIIANADIYSGGFSAQYGGRISSVMDISTRDGNKVKHNGNLGFSPFGAKIQLDGPLKKLNADGGGISYVLSAKHSYLDKTSKSLYSYVNNGDGLPFNFTDIYGKISFGGGNGSKVNLFGFSFNDAVTNYQSLSNLGWKSFGFGGNFVVVPSSSPVIINGVFAYSDYKVNLSELSLPDRFSNISSFNFGLDFKYNIKKDVLRYGIEAVGFNTGYSTFSILNPSEKVELTQSTSELNGFVDYKFNRNRFVIEPSLRLQYYGSLSVFSPEPRIGVKFKWTERLRLKGAAGVYTQNLMATNSDRDVINLFYGFLAGPEDLPSSYIDSNIAGEKEKVDTKNSLQKAIHYVAGFEFDITEKLNLNMEGYFKDFRQLTNINRNKIYNNTAENADKPDFFKQDFVIETGWAAGCDMVLKFEENRLYLWLVYSLGKVNRWNGNDAFYSPVFDRRHNVNFVGSYKLGKQKNYEVSARWNMGSGLPFTQTQGYYQAQGVTGGISLDYVGSNSNYLAVQFANLNEGRLPFYHRLDLNAKRNIKMKKSMELDINVGVTNTYDRRNVFYIDRITGERVDQLPILPNIGIDWKF